MLQVNEGRSLASRRLATRLSFFAAGFAMACWAPLVPFAKANVGADDAQFGLLLLCLGVGSVVAMPVTGWVSSRYGARPMILAGGIGMLLTLPLLVLQTSPIVLGAVLFGFGASLGAIDVAMNIHAIEVERLDERPLMSGFHAMFSLGGIAGAGGIAALLIVGLTPTVSASIGSAVVLAALIGAAPKLLLARGGGDTHFALPRGIVLLLAILAGIMFLVEGAILDWSALLVLEKSLVPVDQAGLGYMLFAIAMTIGRFSGDRIIARLGDRAILVGGGLLSATGIAALASTSSQVLAVLGFICIGLGAANLVPILFSLSGRQTIMPVGLAVAAVSTIGYAGILLGPAIVGFVSQQTSLPIAFWLLAAMVAVVPLTANAATGSYRSG